MEEERRNGDDRRQNHIPPPGERRATPDRREMLLMSDKTREKLMGMLIFEGMTIGDISVIVRICTKKEIPADTPLYRIGDPSGDMLILVKGKIHVLTIGGAELQTYEPYDVIGEMGIFTDTPRSATVITATDSTVLRITKTELFRVLDSKRDLKERMLVNIIKVVSDKLRRQNEIIEQQMLKIRQLELI